MSSHTFLFADLAGFTALTEVHGDERAADFAGEFAAAVRSLLAEHGAEEIKSIGDALMVHCHEAAAALQLGLRVVHGVGSQDRFPIVRVGMHTGPAVARAGDWFGATVNTAARVSGMASGGEVLLTEATATAAGSVEGIEVRPRGREQLRNVAEPVLLYVAAYAGERSALGLPVDPVCRMAVDPANAVGALRYEGVELHFCSLECVRCFAAEPGRYAGS